jgi:signal transduction histidine kinase
MGNEVDDDEGITEAASRALAAAWFGAVPELGSARQQVDPVLDLARARGDKHLLELSQGFEALHLALNAEVSVAGFPPGPLARVTEIESQLRDGWWRAHRLAEAALCATHVDRAVAATTARVACLRAHGTASEDRRPPAERLFTDVVVARLQAVSGQFEEALVNGVQANELARASGLWSLQRLTTQALAFTFLSVGDIEGALGVLEPFLAHAQGANVHSERVRYNQLLAYVVGGQTQAAVVVLDANPWLLDAATLRGTYGLATLCACVQAHAGRTESARALLAIDEAQARASAVGGGQGAVAANMAWLRASTLLASGDASRARAAVQEFLARGAIDGTALTPLNGTQLYRLLAQACEALDDARGALQALKRSQEFCFAWVAASMASRLRALQIDPPRAAFDVDANATRLADRLQAVGSASQDAGRQRRFLQHVSHEMRNPLNGVLGMTSLLMLSELDERQRKYVTVAQSSAQMLLSLCNDILDLAKIEAGRFELSPQPVAVAALFGAAVDAFLPQVQAGGVDLTLDLDAHLPTMLLVDRLRLQQIVMNLLSNAAKFTRKGHIQMHAKWRPAQEGLSGTLHVSVRDTGPGLTIEQRSRLFQEFGQADATIAQSHGGSGLGLALCRSLVELMDGTIDVVSEPGQGSTFWFELPTSMLVCEPAP